MDIESTQIFNKTKKFDLKKSHFIRLLMIEYLKAKEIEEIKSIVKCSKLK